MPVQLFQKDTSHYQYEYKLEPINKWNRKVLKFSFKNGKRMRGRKNVPEFVDLIVAKNDVLKFLLTCKDGEDFIHLMDKLKLASEKIYNSRRIRSSCELIYSHAFKYRHFLFIEYFMLLFQNHENSTVFWDEGLKILFKTKLKHADFLRIFFKFQTVYEAKNKKAFQKTCANGCVFILKNYNWAFFKNYVTLWQDHPFEEFITLTGYAIKKFVSFDKIIRLLHECCENEDADFLKYYKKELTFVAYNECTKKCYLRCEQPYAHILFMYGADKYPAPYSSVYERKETEFVEKATMLSLLYCFGRRSVHLMF
jgi:hypothetical protein